MLLQHVLTVLSINQLAAGSILKKRQDSQPSGTPGQPPIPKDFDIKASFFPNIELEDGDVEDNLPPANASSDEVIAQGNWVGTRLFKYNECDTGQQKKINDAYYDQWKLTNRDKIMKNIDWNSAAALEFLAPPGNNKDSQERIQKIFDLASSLIYSYKNPFQHLIHVRCDDPSNVCSDECEPNPGNTGPTIAYTLQEDPDDGYSMINFCPQFFSMRRLRDDAYNYGKGRTPPLNNWIKAYDNTARVMLHELFHLDYFMDGAGDKHIADLTVDYSANENGRIVQKSSKAYGAEFTKILAKYQEITNPDPKFNAGYYVAHNADNLAWYALAQYVQQKSGVYPHLPIVNKAIDGPPYKELGGLTTFGADDEPVFNFTVAGDYSEADEDGLPKNPTCPDDGSGKNAQADSSNIKISGMAPSDAYPEDYNEALAKWLEDDYKVKPAAGSTAPPPDPTTTSTSETPPPPTTISEPPPEPTCPESNDDHWPSCDECPNWDGPNFDLCVPSEGPIPCKCPDPCGKTNCIV